MILYIARKYFMLVALFAAGLAALPLLFARWPVREAAVSALFWTSSLAGAAVYWEFKRRDIWPLFDNLRLSRWLLLTTLIAGNLILTAGIRTWLMQTHAALSSMESFMRCPNFAFCRAST